MVIKSKEFFEKYKIRQNNDKSKKHILRGERNTRYHDRILSKKILKEQFHFHLFELEHLIELKHFKKHLIELEHFKKN